MKGVLRIITILGIPVQVHWSFVLLFFWGYYKGYRQGLEWDGMLISFLLIISLFICVVLHEFGHALSARYYGVGTKDITLSPIGGIARLNRMPEKPLQEFVVAIAGPLVNVFIAIVLGLGLWLFGPHILPVADSNLAEAFAKGSNFIPFLFVLNITMVLFNLLPAFPMDGGRMLRSLLALKFGRVRATKIASIVGRILAVGLLILAVYMEDLVLGFISLFVFAMATHEYRMVKMEDVLNRQQVGDLMRTDFSQLKNIDPIYEAIGRLQQKGEKNFLVFDEWERQCGILNEAQIMSAQRHKYATKTISEFMENDVVQLNQTDSLRTAYYKMQNPDCTIAPVFDNGVIVGVLDRVRLDKHIRGK